MNSADKKTTNTPIALTIAGSDSGGGAGIQADLKTFSALGVYGSSVITAVTAQNTCSVTTVHDIPLEVVKAQIRAVLDDLEINAIKIGMLSSPEIIKVVALELENCNIPIVLDPVMVAKSGDKLLQQDAIDILKSLLLPRATLITPNLPEAAALLECKVAGDEQSMQKQGEDLLQMDVNAVLMKGGHAAGSKCVDLFITEEMSTVRFQSDRVNTNNTHGTGCTLSSAITANLAKSASLSDAIEAAHGYLFQAIRSADSLNIGSGHGPVHHFHNFWLN